LPSIARRLCLASIAWLQVNQGSRNYRLRGRVRSGVGFVTGNDLELSQWADGDRSNAKRSYGRQWSPDSVSHGVGTVIDSMLLHDHPIYFWMHAGSVAGAVEASMGPCWSWRKQALESSRKRLIMLKVAPFHSRLFGRRCLSAYTCVKLWPDKSRHARQAVPGDRVSRI